MHWVHWTGLERWEEDQHGDDDDVVVDAEVDAEVEAGFGFEDGRLGGVSPSRFFLSTTFSTSTLVLSMASRGNSVRSRM